MEKEVISSQDKNKLNKFMATKTALWRIIEQFSLKRKTSICKTLQGINNVKSDNQSRSEKIQQNDGKYIFL